MAGRGGGIATLHYSQKPLYLGGLMTFYSFFCWTNVGHFVGHSTLKMIKFPINDKWTQPNNSDKFGSVWYTKNINFDELGYA